MTMSRREKTLAFLVGGIVLLGLAVFGIRAFLFTPLKEIDRKTAGLRQKLDALKKERRAYFADEERMKLVAQRMFSDDLDKASARSGEMLTRQILQSGLHDPDFTRLPVGPRKLRGASEIGWNVQGEGPLTDVIDLLFLLRASPFVTRLESLAISAGDSPSMVRVRFRYLTIVLNSAPAVDPIELTPKHTLESSERLAYNALITRDVLRPYIKRPPPPPATPAAAGVAAAPPGTPPGPETFKIVSLSEWQGQPEVHVLDLTSQRTFRYKSGDVLAGGKVVMVDYRSMPMPGREIVQSESRVILRFGEEYWSIERGRTLADKRKMTPAELPQELLAKNAKP
jgi:hypothetical protein